MHIHTHIHTHKHTHTATTIFVKNKLSKSGFRVTPLVSSACPGCQKAGECRLTWEIEGVSRMSPLCSPTCLLYALHYCSVKYHYQV